MICDLITNIVMLFCFCVLFRAVFFLFVCLRWFYFLIDNLYQFIIFLFKISTPRWRIFVQWWFSELSTSSSTCSVRHQSSNRTLPNVFSISDSLSVGQLYISFEVLVIWLICSHSPTIIMIHFRFISKLSGSMC